MRRRFNHKAVTRAPWSAMALCLVASCLILIPTRTAAADTYRQKTTLPTLYIETFDRQSVTDHDNYKYCRIIMVNGSDTTLYDSVQIRGRGNTTWTLPKKPYRIKFPRKTRLLGAREAKAKDWVLLANAGDKLLLRNALATCVGEFMQMPFNPCFQFVDLYLNGNYDGNYQLTDQMEVHKGRIEIARQDTIVTDPATDISGGYFLEPEGNTAGDGLYFMSKQGCHIRVHDPKPDVINTKQLNYIKAYINKFETALYGDDFTHEKRGYRQYTDTTSLIDWYLVQEISANPDGFWCSYIYKDRASEILHFGPIWDFDICWNNCSRMGDVTQRLAIQFGYGSNYTIKGWYTRMWADPWFKTAVYNRFEQLREQGLDERMLCFVDSMAEVIRPSRIENYKRWSISSKVYDEVYLFNTYDEYVENIKSFITAHNEYLSSEFLRRRGQIPTKDFVAEEEYSYKIYCKAFPNMTISEEDAQVGISRVKDEDDDAQKWNIHATDGHFMILSAVTGQALADQGAMTGDLLCTTQPDSLDRSQLWDFIPQGVGGYYNIRNVRTGRVAYNKDGMAMEGNPICNALSDDRDATSGNRQWQLMTVGKSVLTPVESIEAQTEYVLAYSAEAQTLRFLCEEVDRERMNFTASLYNSSGMLMGNVPSTGTFSTAGLPQGLYIVTWKFGGSSHSCKFMKR
ncbi:MAG: CotH kinase family protein [Bacteroidaceae bacterium]